jgi:hypothetical protein
MKRVTGIMEVLLILVMVLGKSANATPVVFFDTEDPLVLPGETISVSIFSTVLTDHIRMDRISDADSGIAENLYLNQDYNPPLIEGVAINEGGVLIEGVSTGIYPACPAVSGVLYSFDYTVSEEVMYGEIINIFADSSDGAINQVYVDDSGWKYVTPESLSLTIVPEPATICLLAMGSPLLTRKSKQRL